MSQPTVEMLHQCPLAPLLTLLSGQWTLQIIWVLSTRGATRFGSLKQQVGGISSKVLTDRLRMLELEGLIYRDYNPTVPPEVTYGLTEKGQDLNIVLDGLSAIIQKWNGDRD
jgi:DNA-binding HxlR family transcriptional regulator